MAQKRKSLHAYFPNGTFWVVIEPKILVNCHPARRRRGQRGGRGRQGRRGVHRGGGGRVLLPLLLREEAGAAPEARPAGEERIPALFDGTLPARNPQELFRASAAVDTVGARGRILHIHVTVDIWVRIQ